MSPIRIIIHGWLREIEMMNLMIELNDINKRIPDYRNYVYHKVKHMSKELSDMFRSWLYNHHKS